LLMGSNISLSFSFIWRWFGRSTAAMITQVAQETEVFLVSLC
jgi:hypothetical protein